MNLLNKRYPVKKELELFKNATKAFEDGTGLHIEIGAFQVKQDDTYIDAVLQIAMPGGGNKTFYAEIKTAITQAAIGHIVAQIRPQNQNNPVILVTRYVTPQQADQLKKLKVPFIDMAGNACIDEPPLFVYITGKKPAAEDRQLKKVRVFRPTGLQVVFALLCNPKLINEPYRDIAHAAQVALGTVGWVIYDLKRLDYLLDKGAYGRKIINLKKLFTAWVEAYARDLRPKMYIGRFAMTLPGPLENIDWQVPGVLLGGEMAAAKITNYLKPATATIYLTKDVDLVNFAKNFMIKNRLKKDPNGNIELLATFWNFEYPWQFKEIAPPLLVYADLMATANDRNIETAKMIYDDYLARLIEQD
jgi:hypothetical protein